MSKSIDQMEQFLGWIARILMLLAALGVVAFVANGIRVIAFGEPILEPSADTSQSVVRPNAVPDPPPETVLPETVSSPIDTTGPDH